MATVAEHIEAATDIFDAEIRKARFEGFIWGVLIATGCAVGAMVAAI